MEMIIDVFYSGYRMLAPMENIDGHVSDVNLTMGDKWVSHLALLQ